MSYFMYPMIGIDTLQNAVNIQFDVNITDLKELLFADKDYDEDCCVHFSFCELDEYNGFWWEDEEEIRLTNLVKTFLKDLLPNYDRVIIDLMI